MDRAALLKEVVAELYQVPVESIGPGFALAHPRFQGSAGRGILAAAIRRRIGVYCAQAFSATIYAQLENAVCGPPAAASRPPVEANARLTVTGPIQPAASGGSESLSMPIQIGVDIEMVESMPEVADYWTSDFYRVHFSDAEIAYCVRQDSPRVHFAARWCAKEALAKCDATYIGVDPAKVQVVIQPNGQPAFENLASGHAEHLPFALSLTHTIQLAAAVVASVGMAPVRVP
jgi:phosphopantetheine--protein transferase-like protein